MIFFDALQMKFRNVKLRNKSETCEACLKKLDVQIFDYETFCGTNCAMPAQIDPENNITASDFIKNLPNIDSNSLLIDVRPAV